MRNLPLMLFALLTILQGGALAAPKLDWVAEVYDDGRHNAFTDLIRWNDHYYLCFRHGGGHVSMDGEIIVLRSRDMLSWEPVVKLDTYGDDRDPHFTATPDRLYCYFGTWSLGHGEGTALPDRHLVKSYFASTADGQNWTDVQGVYEAGWWLWRVRYLDGTFYSAAYTALRPTPPARETRLLRSDDGLNWSLVSTVSTTDMAGEADMWLQPGGSMRMISRTGANAVLYTSSPDLQQWQTTPLAGLIHSPAVAHWKDRVFVAGRDKRGDETVTKLWELVGQEVEELLVLPSGGDTAYPGLVVDPASLAGDIPSLFISWYSQFNPEKNSAQRNRNAATIFTARVTLSP